MSVYEESQLLGLEDNLLKIVFEALPTLWDKLNLALVCKTTYNVGKRYIGIDKASVDHVFKGNKLTQEGKDWIRRLNARCFGMIVKKSPAPFTTHQVTKMIKFVHKYIPHSSYDSQAKIEHLFALHSARSTGKVIRYAFAHPAPEYVKRLMDVPRYTNPASCRDYTICPAVLSVKYGRREWLGWFSTHRNCLSRYFHLLQLSKNIRSMSYMDLIVSDCHEFHEDCRGYDKSVVCWVTKRPKHYRALGKPALQSLVCSLTEPLNLMEDGRKVHGEPVLEEIVQAMRVLVEKCGANPFACSEDHAQAYGYCHHHTPFFRLLSGRNSRLFEYLLREFLKHWPQPTYEFVEQVWRKVVGFRDEDVIRALLQYPDRFPLMEIWSLTFFSPPASHWPFIVNNRIVFDKSPHHRDAFGGLFDDYWRRCRVLFSVTTSMKEDEQIRKIRGKLCKQQEMADVVAYVIDITGHTNVAWVLIEEYDIDTQYMEIRFDEMCAQDHLDMICNTRGLTESEKMLAEFHKMPPTLLHFLRHPKSRERFKAYINRNASRSKLNECIDGETQYVGDADGGYRVVPKRPRETPAFTMATMAEIPSKNDQERVPKRNRTK